MSKSLAKDAEPAAYGDAESAEYGDAEPAAYGDAEPAGYGDAEPAGYGDDGGVLSGMAVPVNRTRRPVSIPRGAQCLNLFCEIFGRRDAQDLVVDADHGGLCAQSPAGHGLNAEKAVRARLPVPDAELTGKDLQELP